MPPDQQADRPVYAFQTRSRCPACRSLNTHATHTRGKTQRRVCRDCGKVYHEWGRAV